MKTLDLKTDSKSLYTPSAKKVEIVQVPRRQFAMIDGAIEKGYEEDGVLHITGKDNCFYTLMIAFAIENGYRDGAGLGSKHHEISFGDSRKADPAKLETVLRHPVRKHSLETASTDVEYS